MRVNHQAEERELSLLLKTDETPSSNPDVPHVCVVALIIVSVFPVVYDPYD